MPHELPFFAPLCDYVTERRPHSIYSHLEHTHAEGYYHAK